MAGGKAKTMSYRTRPGGIDVLFTIPTELQQGTNVSVVLDGSGGVNVDVAKKRRNKM
jgi:hypothetical protein